MKSASPIFSSTAGACPGPHWGPELPPNAVGVGPDTAVCTECGTASQICPARSCGGRTRAGGLYCRTCGHRLPERWRKRFWEGLGPGQCLQPAVVARVLEEPDLVNATRIYLVTSDAWLALCLDERVLLVEPGPGLRFFSEARLEAGEILIGLRVGLEGEKAVWRMLTTRRQLELDPASGSWRAVEELPYDLLWESRGLRAYLPPGGGTALHVGEAPEALIVVPGLLSPPAWLPEDRFICHVEDAVYLGSVRDGAPPVRFETPKPLGSYPPVFDERLQRAILSGEGTLFSWQPGKKNFVPFLPAGGGPVLLSPEGIVALESDRLRIVGWSARILWDSRSEMPGFSRATADWDRAGNALLVPLATRGAGIQLLLADLGEPGRYWRTELEAGLAGDPRLVPGGIAAVRRKAADGTLELLWMGFSREAE